jgi:hypothetical protein
MNRFVLSPCFSNLARGLIVAALMVFPSLALHADSLVAARASNRRSMSVDPGMRGRYTAALDVALAFSVR